MYHLFYFLLEPVVILSKFGFHSLTDMYGYRKAKGHPSESHIDHPHLRKSQGNTLS